MSIPEVNKYPILLFSILLVAVLLTSCNKPAHEDAARNRDNEGSPGSPGIASIEYCASIYPLKMILDELVRDRAEVVCFMSPGASPHTFEPSPKDVAAASDAKALFWVSENLDGWAVDIETRNAVKVIDLLPESDYIFFNHSHENGHDHMSGNVSNENESVIDPHFWTSPKAVIDLVEPLKAKLVELDPDGVNLYNRNAESFIGELRELDSSISRRLAPYEGKSVVLFHPSFLYLLRDYGLNVAGLIEPSPGKEPSPRQVLELKTIVEKNDMKALFTEPQLPIQPVQILAGETGLPLYELDPLGGSEGRSTYQSLVEFNVNSILKAFASDGDK